MRTGIIILLSLPLTFLLSACISESAKAASEPDASTAKGWTIGKRVFKKSSSVNAADFGLKPGSRVDQSSVLAKVIQHVSETSGIDTVYVPQGAYYIAKAIVLKAGINLIGDGPGKTVFVRKDASNYLMRAKQVDFGNAVVANLTLHNPQKTLLMQHVQNLRFQNVEFRGGLVRFVKSSDIILEGNVFNENLGKGGYASSKCKKIRIVKNVFNSIERGSINLSGHENCYVAHNHITSTKLIDSGYAGIRLPNSAKNNVIEHNFIQNHGRGLFILSSSINNILRNNTVRSTKYQGVLIQASNNLLEKNTIIDAGCEAIYVSDATAESSPTPSVAEGNRILNNIIYDTQAHDASRYIGIKISSRRNVVKGNKVSMTHGRRFKSIRTGAGNQDVDNVHTQETRDSTTKEPPR